MQLLHYNEICMRCNAIQLNMSNGSVTVFVESNCATAVNLEKQSHPSQ